MDYPGKVITKTQVTPTQTSASGNWTLDDQAAAIKNNNWPVALVPNPISKSLRFNSADSAYLNRTPASAGSRTTWTWSGWVKRSALGVNHAIISCGSYSTDLFQFYFEDATNSLRIQNFPNSTTANVDLLTSAVYRDLSAWYHIVVVMDTTQATSSNRVKLYVNGSQVTAFSTATYPAQNATPNWNTGSLAHLIGARSAGVLQYSGYMTEINFVDGQALTQSSFGMTNPQTGQWIPLKYSGTYGTNGFYVNFKDATSTTTLGYDYSGNANNWTTNNFSVTAGAGNDSLTDVPTPWFAYNTTGDVGGVFRGNYCTWNPTLPPDTFSQATNVLNGNLQVKGYNASFNTWAVGTMPVSSGKWYFEFLSENASDWQRVGILLSTTGRVNPFNGTYYQYYSANGNKLANGVDTAYGATWTTNDVIGVALDLDNGKLWFSKNGTYQASGDPVAGTNAAFTGLSGSFLPVATLGSDPSNSAYANFGQRPFAYTPPTGFRSLCTTNLPATAIGFGPTNQGGNYFNPVLYSGNGSSSRAITGVGFAPDFTWLKVRNDAQNHRLFDTVRGANKRIISSSTVAEATSTDELTAFGSDGFTLGDNSDINGSGFTFVSWNWNAGGSTVTNTSGTISSQVRASTTAGFSVVTWTGSASASDQTVGHGLGSTPNMVILKNRSVVDNWFVYHSSATTNTQYLNLNTTSAVTNAGSNTWGAGMTSTLVGLRPGTFCSSSSDNVVMYCFAAVPGYSAFGSYTGNGSTDGPFVYLGFRPEFVMIKNATTAGTSWEMFDNAREPSNLMDLELLANSTAAEGTYTYGDFVSNGFKLRSTNNGVNQSTATLIYMAFAEFPFQFANAR
jgi:hypothetical protein